MRESADAAPKFRFLALEKNKYGNYTIHAIQYCPPAPGFLTEIIVTLSPPESPKKVCWSYSYDARTRTYGRVRPVTSGPITIEDASREIRSFCDLLSPSDAQEVKEAFSIITREELSQALRTK